jgi:hypothetical protein
MVGASHIRDSRVRCVPGRGTCSPARGFSPRTLSQSISAAPGVRDGPRARLQPRPTAPDPRPLALGRATTGTMEHRIACPVPAQSPWGQGKYGSASQMHPEAQRQAAVGSFIGIAGAPS